MGWGTLFSGTAMLIHDQPQLKFVYYSSAPRWFLEGYFSASTVYPYEKVRSGRLKGEVYYKGVHRAKQTYAYYNNFWDSARRGPNRVARPVASAPRRRSRRRR